VIQFLYGEDGLAGEHVEDLSIDLIKMDNAQMEQRHNFLPPKMKNAELEELLTRSMSTDLAHKILNDANSTIKLQEEFKQLV
jgi:hypothetical protein